MFAILRNVAAPIGCWVIVGACACRSQNPVAEENPLPRPPAAAQPETSVAAGIAGITLSEVREQGSASMVAPYGLCLRVYIDGSTGPGFLPNAAKQSAEKDGWLAAGMYELTNLTAYKVPSSKGPGKAPITTAKYQLIEGWTGNAPKEFVTQFGCGTAPEDYCEYNLKVGTKYALILNHANWPVESIAWPLQGTFVKIPWQCYFTEQPSGGWSNAVSHGGIGTKKSYTLADIKTAVVQAIAETAKTGACTVDLPADDAPKASAGPSVPPKAKEWPMPGSAGSGGSDASAGGSAADAAP